MATEPKIDEQRHPEHDRAVEPAPVRRELVGQRQRGVRVALDVLDGVVAGDEGVDEHRRGDDHQRREEVERPDAALDEARRAAAGAGDGRRDGIGARDEGGQQDERTECRHGWVPVVLLGHVHASVRDDRAAREDHEGFTPCVGRQMPGAPGSCWPRTSTGTWPSRRSATRRNRAAPAVPSTRPPSRP